MNRHIPISRVQRFAAPLLLCIGCALSSLSHAKTVHYELRATLSSVNMSGKKPVDFVLMLNGSIPGPTLEFQEGDDAEIVVINEIPKQELSVHWHGILLPSEMDGVPYVTTPPILSGERFIFKFRVRQHGTYWYHSHTNVQEQKGLYGPIVIYPKSPSIKVQHDVIAVLSDWSDEDALDILANLRKDGDFYLRKKNTVRSWFGAIAHGKLGHFLANEWQRMGGMDLSDVGYDAFLINGKREISLVNPKKGERVRIRLINAGASTYFYVSLAGQKFTVVSADGIDTTPKTTTELLMGMAETYDIVWTQPDDQSYELRITAQDQSGMASAWIGAGEKVTTPERAPIDLYATMNHSQHSQHQGHDGHSGHDMHHMPSGSSEHEGHSVHSMEAKDSNAPFSVDQLEALQATSFSTNIPRHDVKLVLDGDMSRYVWHINGKAIHEERTLEIQEGQVIRWTLVNNTMMHHPMHLHGHFFRVLTSAGEKSPLKHTVDVPPHSSRTIEFLANEPGEWMLHCHNLYHLKNGMARVIKYSSFTPKPEMLHFQHHDPHLHDHWYTLTKLELASNHAQADFRLSQTWNVIEFRIEGANIQGKNFSYHNDWDYEGDLFYRRWFGNNLSALGGITNYAESYAATLGVAYILPMLVEAKVFVNHRGRFRIDLEKRFRWSTYVFTDVDFTWRPKQGGEHPVEFEVSLMIEPSWYWAFGAMVTNDSIGGGLEVQF